MIIITGAAGFIGSFLAKELNSIGRKDLILVDDFSRMEKIANFESLLCIEKVDRNLFFTWLNNLKTKPEAILHMGARTDTSEQSVDLFNRLNFHFSQEVWKYCTGAQVPLIYASSAATYGDGHSGFSDSHEIIPNLMPLNPYGDSKQKFDAWVLQQENAPPQWQGLKFFNVFGPNEAHKGRMASVIFHAFHQVKESGMMKLFRSHRADFEDGCQLRDFIYVKDVVSVILFLMNQKPANGLYNLGTGKARTFLDLVKSVFESLEKPLQIEWVDIPLDIRETYQYFTEAKMEKLILAGYQRNFYSLEEGIEDYVKNYLVHSGRD